ncbi:hypothetical protein FDP41_004938 [Naegleria fowleri]|uniref:Adenosine kinase n=1 Tax=Naegleria fowleri TaxID=5763 RepID=A0A6A5BEK9_NAEFO|nr:uncharacterized protein FDP41_004938 [Naegleria fowleri]KAF0976263.1 hypothetical protein FDP41_004938 [Naegleria fowleri]
MSTPSTTVPEGCLFGMCNPLLDISAVVPHTLIEKYNAPVGGAILAEEKHLPLYAELVQNYPVRYIAGGATQNVMRVFQWMNQVSYPTAVFVGCVGDDEYGRIMKESVTKDGLKVIYQITKERPTGTCAALVCDNERALIANLGAAEKYSHEHYKSEEVQQAVRNASMFYISGFFVTVSFESVLETAKHACENNKIFAFNLSALFLIQFFHDKMMQTLPYTDYLFGNEEEARAFAKSLNWDETDVADIAAKVSLLEKKNSKRPRYVIFTQGPEAVCIGVNGTSHKVPVKKIPKEKIVDTNGAGDSFVGGFLSFLAKGKSIDECVKAGIYTSSTIIQYEGCTYPEKPDFSQIDA